MSSLSSKLSLILPSLHVMAKLFNLASQGVYEVIPNCFSNLIDHFSHFLIFHSSNATHCPLCSLLSLHPHILTTLFCILKKMYIWLLHIFWGVVVKSSFPKRKKKKKHRKPFSDKLAYSGHFLFFEFLHILLFQWVWMAVPCVCFLHTLHLFN